MKYDDATWHADALFPHGLSIEDGATHIGMFAAWCMLNGLAGELHTEGGPGDLQGLRQREVTPGAWFVDTCDCQLNDEDLNDEGNAFAAAYYDQGEPSYLSDLMEATHGKLPSRYHLPDTWYAYDQLAKLLQFRFDAWKRKSA
jgi:hypothetical protein